MRLLRIDHLSLDVRDRRPRSPRARPCSAHAPRAPRDALPRPEDARLGLLAERPPSIRPVALATDSVGAGPRVQAGDRLAVLACPRAMATTSGSTPPDARMTLNGAVDGRNNAPEPAPPRD